MPDSSGATVFDDLPEWLVVDEILVRLPPKDVVRCCAVRKSWLSAGASNQKIRHLLRYAGPETNIAVMPQAACDGFLIFSPHPEWPHFLGKQTEFYICNPAIHKCASLPHPPRRPGMSNFSVVAFYRHRPSGEHRVLWFSHPFPVVNDTPHLNDYCVLTVGSDQPRRIQPPRESLIDTLYPYRPPLLYRGCLHWALDLSITVFDPVAETFRQMSLPAQLEDGNKAWLFEMDGVLALCGGSCDNYDI